MFRALILTASLAALSAPAYAEEVHVSLAGKDAATIRADITRAAERVCNKAYRSSPRELYELGQCVRDSTDAALAQIPSQQAANTTSSAMQVAAR